MPDALTCPKCGTVLSSTIRGEGCLRCLLELGLLPASSNDDLDTCGERIGPYRLIDKLGEGGCGEVFLAEQDVSVRRHVALKIIKPGMDSKSVIARFEAERQALALMDHPNIAKVFEAGATESGRPYFAMELVLGKRVTDYCDQQRLALHDRIKVFIDVCSAVQHAHQKGIIHRDLKPSNILVDDSTGVPSPKVIDFGIAKAVANQQIAEETFFTAFEQFVGTPAYMSPEQASLGAMDIDTRSDTYSLGVLLQELISGETPFDSQSLSDAGLEGMTRIIREKDPVLPSKKLRSLSHQGLSEISERRQIAPNKLIQVIQGDLDWVILKALEKDRDRRYQSAAALADDLERYLTHQPVLARPPSAIYRTRKVIRRNRLAFGAGTALSIVITVSGVFYARLFIQQEKAFNRAMYAEKLAQTESRRADAEATEAKIQRDTAIKQRERATEEKERADSSKAAVSKLLQHMFYNQLGNGTGSNSLRLPEGLLFDFVLDEKLQKTLDQELQQSCEALSPKTAIGIIVEPCSGDILAMSIRPSLGATNVNPAVNTMIEPGGLLKFIAGAGALNEGAVECDSLVDCENGRFSYEGHVYSERKGFGVIPVALVLAKQSSIGSAKLALQLGDQKFFRYLGDFGIGETPDVPMVGVSRGILHPFDHWPKGSGILIAGGHGIAATPLQITMAMCAIANGGILMQPRTLRSISDRRGQIVSFPPQAVRRVLSTEAANKVKDCLSMVPSDQGLAPLAKVPGYKVAGTVTSTQKVISGMYSEECKILGFCGFVPADAPRFVCLILIDEPNVEKAGNYGSLVAAPLFSRIATQVMHYLSTENAMLTK